VAGNNGTWQVVAQRAVCGEPLPAAPRLELLGGLPARASTGESWRLRGVVSNERYVHRTERVELVSRQEGLGRPTATCAAFIPIRKNASWWALTQEERREIFEESSRHIRIGLKYLPAIARRLHHCRDLSEDEPFDFLTWFEYEPGQARAFEDLVGELRGTVEWSYVVREFDLRLERD
jgi:chlorite dismutase